MTKLGPSEKLYPVVKIAMVVDALKDEGVSAKEALAGIHLSETQLCSPEVRVSANQVIQSYCNAIRQSRNPHFAYLTGLRFHVSTYGMYGFAMLSSTDFRRTMAFAVEYHQLAAPLVDVQFSEQGKVAVWTMTPFPFPQVDAPLYKFIVELQAGVHVSLHRDIMGQSFHASKLHFTFGRPRGAQKDVEVFGCPVVYGQPENKFFFDADWLNATPNLGNEVTYSQVLQLCSQLLSELKLSTGVAGKVREICLSCMTQPTSFERVAGRLGMSMRTLRRKLEQEGTSFRELIDELRAHAAIKYVRDTDLTIEDIAYALGFSDAAAFRHAFRRWTKSAPNEYRRARIDIEPTSAG
ncbi:MAG TPA: AraC family transcriptional regulator [Bradyrhizobium sp.]